MAYHYIDFTSLAQVLGQLLSQIHRAVLASRAAE
jgi:hypothetical protein